MKETLSIIVVLISLLLVAAGGSLTGRLVVEDSITRGVLGLVCVIVGVGILVIATSGYTIKQGTKKPRTRKTE